MGAAAGTTAYADSTTTPNHRDSVMNSIQISGNITNDITVRGKATRFRLAVDRNIKQADGTYKKARTSFFNVVAFGKRGEAIASSFKKGQHVTLSGSLNDNSWQDDQGNYHNVVEIVANKAEATAFTSKANSPEVTSA